MVDSSNPDFLESGDAMDQDFTQILEGRYPWATEVIDTVHPERLVHEIAITCFADVFLQDDVSISDQKIHNMTVEYTLISN